MLSFVSKEQVCQFLMETFGYDYEIDETQERVYIFSEFGGDFVFDDIIELCEYANELWEDWKTDMATEKQISVVENLFVA